MLSPDTMNLQLEHVVPIITIGGIIVYLLRVKYTPIDTFNKHKEEIYSKLEAMAAKSAEQQANMKVMEVQMQAIKDMIEVHFNNFSKELGHLNNNIKQFNNNSVASIERSDRALMKVEALEERLKDKI